MSETRQVRIIGFGNTLRGDDGLGWAAAEALQRQALTGVEILTCHQLTLDLAAWIRPARLAILIDAEAGNSPGQISQREVTFDPNAADTLHHHQSPEGLLAGARALYGAAPRMALLTVCGKSFEFAEGLSPEVSAALPDLLARIEVLIRSAA
jgi:hydrogenase maturation protease